jgi:glycerate kinase
VKHVLVAPNAFKGSLSAREAARVMARAVRRGGATPLSLPLADGGDGTLEFLKKPLGLCFRRKKIIDPLGRPLTARWGYNAQTRIAVIEMARASGLGLLNEGERRPLETSSYGTGLLIHAALTAGAQTVWIGLGGSATVDGGLGILQALGVKIYIQRNGRVSLLDRPAKGKDLVTLHSLDSHSLKKIMKGVKLRVLCDVSNPLLGLRGAARAFGPQKGATPSAVLELERGLARFAHVMGLPPWRNSQGMGAAGGAAAGLRVCAKGHLESGTQTLFRLAQLEEKIVRSDVVLTGEGQVDQTSWEGKSLGGLIRLCRHHKKPLVVFTGRGVSGTRCPGVDVVCLGGKKDSLSQKIRRAGFFLGKAVEFYFKNSKNIPAFFCLSATVCLQSVRPALG